MSWEVQPDFLLEVLSEGPNGRIIHFASHLTSGSVAKSPRPVVCERKG